MNAVFHDLQDSSSSFDRTTIRDRNELLSLLDSFDDREPFGCELLGENGFKLTLGIGKNVGFVQHSPSDGDTPYLLAVSGETHFVQRYVEFFVGDTPTPIPQRFCLPFEIVKQIAGYFIETGERWPGVSWEEVSGIIGSLAPLKPKRPPTCGWAIDVRRHAV